MLDGDLHAIARSRIERWVRADLDLGLGQGRGIQHAGDLVLVRVEEDEARDDRLALEAIEHGLELGLEQLGHSREQVQLVTRKHGVLQPGPGDEPTPCGGFGEPHGLGRDSGGSKGLREALHDLIHEHDGALEREGDGPHGHVVVGWPDAAAGEDDLSATAREREGLDDGVDVIRHDVDPDERNTAGTQALDEKRAVALLHLGGEHLVADDEGRCGARHEELSARDGDEGLRVVELELLAQALEALEGFDLGAQHALASDQPEAAVGQGDERDDGGGQHERGRPRVLEVDGELPRGAGEDAGDEDRDGGVGEVEGALAGREAGQHRVVFCAQVVHGRAHTGKGARAPHSEQRSPGIAGAPQALQRTSPRDQVTLGPVAPAGSGGGAATFGNRMPHVLQMRPAA